MRICLVAPAWQQLVNSYPPLGLAYVAARVETAGHHVCIEDFNLPPYLSQEEQIERIAESRPDLVGITCMSHVYHGARLLAQEIKSRLGCAVVLGGPHPSIYKETLLEEQSIDFVVYGEGEETLLELSECLEEGRTPEHVAGLCWRREGEAVRNRPRVAAKELDTLPFPARHLLRLQDYPLRAPDGTPMATLITSRGCPYDCSFCFKGLFGRTYRQRSVANVIHEIAELTRAYQIRNFYFVDDLFTLNREWLHDFSQAIVGADLNIRWKCLARVDRVNPHILQQMRQAGCREIHYGIESGSDTILKRITKKVSLSQVKEAVSWTRQAGMLVKGYFMLGLPGDTEETVLSTVDFASSLELDEAMFSLTTPFPGTRLWQDMVRERPEILEQDLSRAYYFNLNGKEMLPFINVSEVSDGRLAELHREAVDRFRRRQEKAWYQDRIGELWGGLAWSASRVPMVRRLARILSRSGLLPALPNEREFLVRRWA